MWKRIITKQEIQDLAPLVEMLKGEVSTWEVIDNINSEASFSKDRLPDLSILQEINASQTASGLRLGVSISGYSSTIRSNGNTSCALRNVADFIFHNQPVGSRAGFVCGFRHLKMKENFMSFGLQLSQKDKLEMVINAKMIEAASLSQIELIEIARNAGKFTERPHPSKGFILEGSSELDVGLSAAEKIIDVNAVSGVNINLAISSYIQREDYNNDEVDAWISALVRQNFEFCFRWEVVIKLWEGHPSLGRENDGFLALCDKLIYIGTYDEGEGEVHVSLLEKRGGARHLALDSKYPLLKSQIPKSLRHLEWKRG